MAAATAAKPLESATRVSSVIRTSRTSVVFEDLDDELDEVGPVSQEVIEAARLVGLIQSFLLQCLYRTRVTKLYFCVAYTKDEVIGRLFFTILPQSFEREALGTDLTQKTWQLRMRCNLRLHDATPVLFRLNYDAMPSLKSLNLSIAVL